MAHRAPTRNADLQLHPAHRGHAGLWWRLRQEATTRRHNVLEDADESELARRLAAGASDLRNRAVHEYRWVLMAGDEAIGMVGVGQPSWLLGEATVSVLISEVHQGRGYGTGAMALLVDLVFSETNLNRLLAYISGENQASMHLTDRLGFTRLGEYPDHYLIQGRRVSQVCYALTRESWTARRRAMGR